MELPEEVDEAPGNGLLESIARVDVEVGVVDAAIGMIDVDRFGRDVESPVQTAGRAGSRCS